jgi:hypothetical protein
MARAHNDLPKNLINRLTAYRKVLVENLASLTSIDTPQGKLGPTELVADIDHFFAICSKVDATHRAWMVALLARTNETPSACGLADRSKAYIRAQFAPGHPVVSQRFLRGPGGKHKISLETHLIAAEERRQTRKLRKTMGKRQRAKIKAQ